jgi:hypothetical protein
MTLKRKEALTKLTMLKLMYGGDKIPLASDVNQSDYETINIIATLASAHYLVYRSDYVVDDEGISLGVDRGYVLAPKALKLLKEKAK